jgi:aspartate--ammonia ligase
MQVGKILNSGKIHDARAPDYDDWDLNGDILVYYEPLDMSLELSSMGIRVDAKSLDYQLKIMKKENDINYDYHKMISKD